MYIFSTMSRQSTISFVGDASMYLLAQISLKTCTAHKIIYVSDFYSSLTSPELH